MRPSVPTLVHRPTSPLARRGKHRAAVALPPVGERLLPWLGGSVLVAVLVLIAVVLRQDQPSIADLAPLVLGLGTTVVIAGLVARRSAQAVATHDREQRARPSRDQLSDLDAGGRGAQAYLHGMEHWTAALLELVGHATQATDDEQTRRALTSAGEDTEALRVLLQASTHQAVSLSDVATLHSVSALWETGQDRMEELAASVDPAWHRRWRARSIVERSLRHGPPAATEPGLPYRT